MLLSLSVRNFILMESQDIAFAEGMTVMTGETGAGKSIMLDALGFVLGDRIDQGIARHADKDVSITAEVIAPTSLIPFLKEHALIEESADTSTEGETHPLLLLRRVYTSKGRSKVWVNDQPISLSVLKKIGKSIFDIHSQSGHAMTPSYYLDIVDRFGTPHDLLVKAETQFKVWQTLQANLQKLQAQKEDRDARMETLLFYIQELEALAPQLDEENILLEKRTDIKNSLAHQDTFRHIAQIFDKGLVGMLRDMERLLEKDESLKSVRERVSAAFIDMQDIEGDIRQQAFEEAFAPDQLTQLDDRLHALRHAARKHKVSANDLYQLKEDLEKELDAARNLDMTCDDVQKQALDAEKRFQDIADVLHDTRAHAGEKLVCALMQELPPLKLENATFSIDVQKQTLSRATRTGCNVIHFLFSANPGMSLQPLEKIASGGELSRFMLALKVVLSQYASTPTLIFDEIDSGVGGAVAMAMGRHMKRLAQHQQVIAITHSPQVAAFANTHTTIAKYVHNDATFVTITALESTERTKEIARMLSGDRVTDHALEAANVLLEGSHV